MFVQTRHKLKTLAEMQKVRLHITRVWLLQWAGGAADLNDALEVALKVRSIRQSLIKNAQSDGGSGPS